MSEPRNNRGASKQDYATPVEFIRAVEQRFGPITWDLAASDGNAKSVHYFSERDNSLVQDWAGLRGRLWLNPPFANIGPWAEKCARSAGAGMILMLTPASIGSAWFAQHVHGKAMVYALSPRLSFDGKNPFPKDCILSVYGDRPGFDVWRWKP